MNAIHELRRASFSSSAVLIPPRAPFLLLNAFGPASIARGMKLRHTLAVSALVTLAAGCATTGTSSSEPTEVQMPAQVVVRHAVDHASNMVGQADLAVEGEHFAATPTGLVAAAYAAGGLRFQPGVIGGTPDTEEIWELMAESGRGVDLADVAAGDILFFDNTFDANGNGVRDDLLTHVALVESVSIDGTISFFHYTHKGVSEGVVTPAEPSRRLDPVVGAALNTVLRLRADGGPRLAGQLLVGAARPIGDLPSSVAVDAVAAR